MPHHPDTTADPSRLRRGPRSASSSSLSHLFLPSAPSKTTDDDCHLSPPAPRVSRCSLLLLPCQIGAPPFLLPAQTFFPAHLSITLISQILIFPKNQSSAPPSNSLHTGDLPLPRYHLPSNFSRYSTQFHFPLASVHILH
jgi:hypothetical protein